MNENTPWYLPRETPPGELAKLRRDRDELVEALETAHGEICRLMDEYGHVSGAMVARHCLDVLARVNGR